MSDGEQNVRTDIPAGYVEIVSLARLWASVPPRERITHEDIDMYGPKSDGYRQPLHDILDRPGCEIATRQVGFGATYKWLPCRGEVNDDGKRCSRHGGPHKTKDPSPTRAQLLAEIARLKAAAQEQQ